jgi:hypothetical protein
MSEPTGPAPANRPSVVAMVLGLVVVAAVIAGALALEQATDNDLDLPGSLPGGLHADESSKLVDSAEANLEDALDAPVTVRSYRTEDDERLVTLTIVDEAVGPFAPSGPQADAALLGLARAPFELVRRDDVVCDLAWNATVPDGEPVPKGDPIGMKCQLGADGLTYWLSGRGLSFDDAVDILESVAD